MLEPFDSGSAYCSRGVLRPATVAERGTSAGHDGDCADQRKDEEDAARRSFGGVAVGPIEHRSSSGEDGGGPQFVELPAARHQGDSEGKPYRVELSEMRMLVENKQA